MFPQVFEASEQETFDPAEFVTVTQKHLQQAEQDQRSVDYQSD